MEELIDILNRNGTPTGQSAPKSEIHSKGLYHNTVHIWLYTKLGNILLAQRAATKTICPLLWDVSVAGHIDAGEDLLTGALREINEEISLTLAKEDLYKIGVFPCFQSYANGIIDNEFHHTFIAELKTELDTLKPQPNEVENLKLVSLEEAYSLLKNSDLNGHFIASNSNYYSIVFEAITNKIR
jgi:isopentenyldiphosphate isomerase